MGRKRVLKISKNALVLCPQCAHKNRLEVKDAAYSFECRGCKQKIMTPTTRCCIICAYSGKMCPASAIREAKAKNLQIRQL